MNDVPIWRYLTLAKYIDLLRTESLFFPKASLFNDYTEGKWIAHAVLLEQSRRWSRAEANAKILEELIEKAGNDEAAMLQEANSLLTHKRNSMSEVLRDVLRDLGHVYPHKRREYLEGMISSWRKLYDNHNTSVESWSGQIAIYRESTYISCWNRASFMSVAMWEMYAGGREGIAVRSSENKLKALIEYNSVFLQQYGLEGATADVQYFDRLKSPDVELHDHLLQMLSGEKDVTIAMFSVKPNIFEYEREIRAIIFPKRGLFDSIKDPHPDKSGFSLPVGKTNPEAKALVVHFIDAVHIHPTLSSDSMMFNTVTELNKLFGVAEIPVIADSIEALGPDVLLQPSSKRGR